MARTKKQSTEAAVREIRRRTRRKFAPEEKVRIVLEGLRGEQSISELCRREGIASNLYYRWSKDFLEAEKMGIPNIAAIHGSPWKYDTYVPVFFAGNGVPARKISRLVGPMT